MNPTSQYLFIWDEEAESYRELARIVAAMIIDDSHELALQHGIGIGQMIEEKNRGKNSKGPDSG